MPELPAIVWDQTESDEKVEVKPDLVLPRQICAAGMTISTFPGIRFDIGVEWNADTNAYRILTLGMTKPDGINSDDLSGMSKTQILAFAMEAMLNAQYKDESGELQPLTAQSDDPAQIRAQGPSDDSLRWVARRYAHSRALGGNPNKSVMRHYEIPQRTATRWIASARARGFLD